MPSSRSRIATLTEEKLAIAVRRLARRDPDLCQIVQEYGNPPL